MSFPVDPVRKRVTGAALSASGLTPRFRRGTPNLAGTSFPRRARRGTDFSAGQSFQWR